MSLQIRAIFSSVRKDKGEKKREKKFAHSYLGNALCNFLQIWCVVSLGGRAPPQQLLELIG